MRKVSFKLMLLIILQLFLITAVSFAQVAVIANESVPQDTIEKAQLLDFYTRDIRLWSDGNPVVIFDLEKKDSVKVAFYDYLGKSCSRMKSIWMKTMLSGECDPPESIESEDKMREKVASTPGAIGYISLTNVNENVKILAIIEEEDE